MRAVASGAEDQRLAVAIACVFYAPKVAGAVANGRRGALARSPVRSAQELKNVTMQAYGPDFAIEGYFHDVYRNR